MGQLTANEVPTDWYRRAFPAEETTRRPWADRTEAEVDRALAMLAASAPGRVLDLACGTGRHALELARRGFSVVGVDIARDLLDIAEADARAFGLAAGWVDYKICAVDATWSGLLFARRKLDLPDDLDRFRLPQAHEILVRTDWTSYDSSRPSSPQTDSNAGSDLVSGSRAPAGSSHARPSKRATQRRRSREMTRSRS